MSIAATYIDATNFSVTGDQTLVFTAGRIVKLSCGPDGYKYGTISSSAYTTLTTVTIEESVITANLTSCYVGEVQTGSTGSLPKHSHVTGFGQGGSLDFDAIPLGNTVIVAKSGGQYTSIQSAIDSITDAASDNVYLVSVYPGVYTENITMKNYVHLNGADGRRGAKIYGTSGTLITMADTECHIDWIDLEMVATNDSDIIIDATAGAGATGFYRVEHSDITLTTAAAIKPKILDAQVGTGIYFISTTMGYTNTNTAVTGTHTPINIQSGNALIYILRSIARGTIGAANGSLATVNDVGTGRLFCEIATLEATFTNAANTGVCAPVAVYGGGAGQGVKQINSAVINATGNGAGTGYGAYFDTITNDGELNSSRNLFNITGFTNNRRYLVGAGDTLFSYFNRTDSAFTDAETGTLRSVDIDDSGDLNLKNTNIFSQVQIGSHDDITAASEGVAASVATETTFVTTNGDSDLDNVTLADGTEGQTKFICCVAEGNAADTWKVTPSNMIGGTQITFAGAGEGCTLKMYSAGWVVVGNNGGTIS